MSPATQSGGFPGASKGAQRLHGRNPANRASPTVAKNVTFSGSGLRAGHAGRQKMPVVFTPVKNTPSYEPSPAMKAATIVSREGCAFMDERLPAVPKAGHRKSGVELRRQSCGRLRPFG